MPRNWIKTKRIVHNKEISEALGGLLDDIAKYTKGRHGEEIYS